jgi:hypothetical protein
MSGTLAIVIACSLLLGSTFAKPNPTKQRRSSDRYLSCGSERARYYNEMSLWAQHKAVKKCVTEALAKH